MILRMKDRIILFLFKRILIESPRIEAFSRQPSNLYYGLVELAISFSITASRLANCHSIKDRMLIAAVEQRLNE